MNGILAPDTHPTEPCADPMKHILLVEDEGGHAELIRRSLAEASGGYTITVAGTLREAQAFLAERPPALALVDYRLPDGLGNSLVMTANGQFPVVLLTAFGSERTAVDTIKAGALDYIVKSPEAFADMPHVIERALREWQHIIERRKAEEALHESEARFRRLLETTPYVAVQGYTPGAGVNYWNRASEAVFGYAADEALQRDPVELIVPPDRREQVRQDIQAMTRSGEPIPAHETTLLRKDGSAVAVFTSHAVVGTREGQPQLFWVHMDLTERKRAEVERLEMERRLLHAQKLESLGVLAGGIAHDFNNLLTAILGNLELAMMDISDVSPARESLLDARAATRRAADLTRQMLAYSGRGRFQIRSVNLSEVVREMAQLLKVSIGKTATLQLHLDAHLPRIQADVAQVQQVVMNLITNASEALDDRVGSITITTSVRDCDEACLAASRLAEKAAPGRYVALVVTDTGCGMDESVQQRLFEPFFTTKFTGRGLGMSAVLGVVRGHKGAICIESAPGAGTTIRVLFPIEEPDDAPHPKEGPECEPPNESPTTLVEGMILLVDDEESVRRVAERMLTRVGFAVVCAEDGEVALRVLEQHKSRITCVLLDLTMPKMDGPATLAALRRIHSTVPVILASGYDQQELTSRMQGIGFAGFAQKPYHRETLLALIQQVCRHAT